MRTQFEGKSPSPRLRMERKEEEECPFLSFNLELAGSCSPSARTKKVEKNFTKQTTKRSSIVTQRIFKLWPRHGVTWVGEIGMRNS